MKYDFDTVIDRRGTNSLKYDFAKERGKSGDVLPLYVHLPRKGKQFCSSSRCTIRSVR